MSDEYHEKHESLENISYNLQTLELQENNLSNIDPKLDLSLIEDLTESLIPVNTDADFTNNYLTKEQTKRDIEITRLLTKYVDSYSEKTIIQKTGRTTILKLCSLIIGLFSLCFLIILLYFSFTLKFDEIGNIVSLISTCIAFLGSILGLFTIITKYCFPEKDEEYITKIVELIQKNDLEHKKENMKSIEKTEEYKREIERLEKIISEFIKETSNDDDDDDQDIQDD